VPEQAATGFGGLLRLLRAEAGLTQEELAEAARLSPRSVSDLERGINRTARKETAWLLADALGLTGPARAEFEAAARGRAVPGGGAHGFPAVLTSFVGRAGAMGDVARLLDECRLVTVTGPGGSGKTRLAAEVAIKVAGQFADGAWLIELAPVTDPAQVGSAVAVALGVREQQGEPAAGAVARVLARRQLLVVLDNCEHVIGAAAELCAGLLVACDDVKILATSREPLAVAGEARYRLAPLAVPDPGDLADAAQAEAVALFADRARHADAGFVLDGQTVPAVARLVARLDGMPLAIELAAARVEALGVTQLLDRLDDRFALLTAGDRLAAGRQRSLAATVAWSYQLLDESERRVFRMVSVFPGPFTLEGAEAVAGPGAGPAVLRLVDCSLLTPPRPGADGRSRYGMLETLRAYGAGLLAEAGEQEQAAAGLAGYAVGVAEQAAAGLHVSAAEAAAARWLDAEDAATRQVLGWAMDRDPAMALRLVAALGWWWMLRGRAVGQHSLLCEAASRGAVGSDGWCAALYWLGYTALHGADLAGALGHFTDLRDAVAARGPSRALADGLTGRATILLNLGRAAEASGEAQQSLAVAREVGYPVGEALALLALSRIARAAGDPCDAVRLARQAGQIPAGIPGSMARLCSTYLIFALIDAGDLASAEDVCAAALAQSREAGDVWNLTGLLPQMVMLDLWAGRTAQAAASLREVFQLAARAGERVDMLTSLNCCGHLCAATGRPAEAVTVWAAYRALRPRGASTDWPVSAGRWDQPLHQARQALGPAQTLTAENRGEAMSLDTAAEYALMLTASGTEQSWAAGLGDLSARERELVTLVAQGCTNAQIAARLHTSVRTVGSQLDRIRDKTGYRRRADLTRLALTAGLV
jgi:predicted ATPase/DNA-binding CsgD family transcriptional regulator/DNA-binding XRE family transcriptional regulator